MWRFCLLIGLVALLLVLLARYVCSGYFCFGLNSGGVWLFFLFVKVGGWVGFGFNDCC